MAEIYQTLLNEIDADGYRVMQQRIRLPNTVEGDVGQGDVFLQDGSVPTPLRETMPQHQRIITQAQ